MMKWMKNWLRRIILNKWAQTDLENRNNRRPLDSYICHLKNFSRLYSNVYLHLAYVHCCRKLAGEMQWRNTLLHLRKCYVPLRKTEERNLQNAVSLFPSHKYQTSKFIYRSGVFFLCDELWVAGSQTEALWASKVQARWNYFGTSFVIFFSLMPGGHEYNFTDWHYCLNSPFFRISSLYYLKMPAFSGRTLSSILSYILSLFKNWRVRTVYDLTKSILHKKLSSSGKSPLCLYRE